MKRFFLLCSLLVMAACAPTPPPPPPPPPAPPPAPPPPPPPQAFNVYFPLGSAQLTSDARQIVAAAANALKNAGTIEVIGHTDTSGSNAANQRLSQQRARNVARALEQDGVPRSSLKIGGRGERDLQVPTGNNVREAQNRRVEITAAGAGEPSASAAPPPAMEGAPPPPPPGAMENAPPPSGAGAPPPPPPPAQ